MTKDSLYALLAHPMTRTAMQRVGRGEDPSMVAAELAGTMFTHKVAEALGASMKPKPWTHDGMVDAKGEPIDADYVVIDVTPGVKRRTKAG